MSKISNDREGVIDDRITNDGLQVLIEYWDEKGGEQHTVNALIELQQLRAEQEQAKKCPDCGCMVVASECATMSIAEQEQVAVLSSDSSLTDEAIRFITKICNELDAETIDDWDAEELDGVISIGRTIIKDLTRQEQSPESFSAVGKLYVPEPTKEEMDKIRKEVAVEAEEVRNSLTTEQEKVCAVCQQPINVASSIRQVDMNECCSLVHERCLSYQNHKTSVGTLWVPLGGGFSYQVTDFEFLKDYNEQALEAEIKGSSNKKIKVRARDLLTMVYATNLSRELSDLVGKRKQAPEPQSVQQALDEVLDYIGGNIGDSVSVADESSLREILCRYIPLNSGLQNWMTDAAEEIQLMPRTFTTDKASFIAIIAKHCPASKEHDLLVFLAKYVSDRVTPGDLKCHFSEQQAESLLNLAKEWKGE